MRNRIIGLLLTFCGALSIGGATPVVVEDEELDRVYAQGLFFFDSETISGIVEELNGDILDITFPENGGRVIIAPSSGEEMHEDPVTTISIGGSAQENAINTVNSNSSAVNQVLNIIVIMNSNINRADLNIINRLRAIDIDLD